jgi:hypothetical protein
MIRRRSVLAALAAALVAPVARASASELSSSQRAVLGRYLDALKAGRYDRAYALLSLREQRYFGSADNYGSIFKADQLKLAQWSIVDAKNASGGVVVTVRENVEFYDFQHQAPLTATARVAYGLLSEGGAVRIKDPYHPWRAVAPPDSTVTTNGLRATVRKVSFFTGYVEFVVTFANVGDSGVTLLPYGRSVLRDDTGKVFHPIETAVDQLTDRQLRLGLVLPSAAQYTGHVSFYTPDRFTPKSLTATFAPSLRDGGDAPFELELPAIPLA